MFRTIGVNDIGRAFTPDYLFCMDEPRLFPPDRLRYIQQSQARYIFVNREMGIHSQNVVRCPVRQADSPRFDDPDALYHVASPPTSPFLALCLAAHMGARAIGLIGVDFTNGHFFAADGFHRLTRALLGIDQRFFLLGNSLLERGVKVFNLSSESRLRAYPRLTLEQFHDLQRSGRPRSWTRPIRRVYFKITTPADKTISDLVRFINLESTLSGRLIAPGSPDIPTGSVPLIEGQILSSSAHRLSSDGAELREFASSGAVFSSKWREHLWLPPLGLSPPPRRERNRRFTFRIIISQQRANMDEVAETVRSLYGGLSPADELVIIGRYPARERVPAWLRSSAAVRYMGQAKSETFAAARNRAAGQCTKDILLFTDAHIQAPATWAQPLEQAFRGELTAAAGPALADMYDRELKGYGMRFDGVDLGAVWLSKAHDEPYPVPLLSGAFLAIRRSTFESLGGFDAGMRLNGDDLEFSFRLWTSGFECRVCPDLEVPWANPLLARAARTRRCWDDMLYNCCRFAVLHLGQARLARFLEAVSSDSQFHTACTHLFSDRALNREGAARQGGKHSDDWFFERFPN